jgi:hypothetical protein
VKLGEKDRAERSRRDAERLREALKAGAVETNKEAKRMKMHSRRLIVSALLSAPLLLSGATCNGPSLPEEAITSFGFGKLTPPSTLTPPGTYVYVRDWDPFLIGTTCTAEDAFGPDLPVRESDTQEAKAIEEKSQNVSLAAEYLKQIKAEVRFKRVKNITYSLANTKIFEIDDARLFASSDRLSEPCADALEFRWENGDDVTLVKQVLQADVKYELEYEIGVALTAEDKLGIVKGLAPKLSADASSAKEHEISGMALYWGIVDDAMLACRLAPEPCEKRTATPSGGPRGPRPEGVDPNHLFKGQPRIEVQ